MNKKRNQLIIILATTLVSIFGLTGLGLGVIYQINQKETIREPIEFEASSLISAVRIINADKQEITLDVEIADSPEEREKGLMNRTQLSDNSGMLFIYQDSKQRTFWMKDTLIPLDIIFINEKLEIMNIHRDAEPLNTDKLYPSEGPAKYVLETNGGWSEQNNIGIGAQVIFE